MPITFMIKVSKLLLIYQTHVCKCVISQDVYPILINFFLQKYFYTFPFEVCLYQIIKTPRCSMLMKQLSLRKLNMLTSISRMKNKYAGGFRTRAGCDEVSTEAYCTYGLYNLIPSHQHTYLPTQIWKSLKENWDLLCLECYTESEWSHVRTVLY